MGELPERVTPGERSLYRAFDLVQGLPDRQLDRSVALLRREMRGLMQGKDTPPFRDFVPQWWE